MKYDYLLLIEYNLCYFGVLLKLDVILKCDSVIEQGFFWSDCTWKHWKHSPFGVILFNCAHRSTYEDHYDNWHTFVSTSKNFS